MFFVYFVVVVPGTKTNLHHKISERFSSHQTFITLSSTEHKLTFNMTSHMKKFIFLESADRQSTRQISIDTDVRLINWCLPTSGGVETKVTLTSVPAEPSLA